MTQLLRRRIRRTSRQERVNRSSPSHGVPVTPMPPLFVWKEELFVTVETAATSSGIWASVDENEDLQIEPGNSQGYAYVDAQGDLILEVTS